MNLIGEYQNGDYTVRIFDDGTKIRENDLDYLRPDFPESMDIKITNHCDRNCPFCHEASTLNGKHGDILNLPFINTLHPYTELAIGGGNPLSHPDLVPFLRKLKERKLIPSMTVNQVHFLQNLALLKQLTDEKLIYGLGVSYTPELVSGGKLHLNCALRRFPNAVVHVINGVISVEELKTLAGYGLKLLILGYKDFRKGADNLSANHEKIQVRQKELYDMLPEIINKEWFKVVSFDNLAIRQLDVKRLMSEEAWRQFYMGDDGGFTMYIDAVNEEYAVSSVSTERYKLRNDIQEMFETIRK